MPVRPLCALALSASVMMLFPAAVSAQPVKRGEFAAQRFQPAPGPRNFFSVLGARTDGTMAWSAGLFANYSSHALVIPGCSGVAACRARGANAQDVNVISSMFTVDALASLTVIPRLQLGLRVPVSFVGGDGFNNATGTSLAGGLQGSGFGDPTVEAKYRAIGLPSDRFVGGVAVFAAVPLGRATAKEKYLGDGSVSAGARAIFDGLAGPLSYAANVGMLFRQDAQLGAVTQGSEFRYGAAVGYAISPLVRVIGEGYGATRFNNKVGTDAFEVLGGAQITPLSSAVSIYLGAGTGLVRGTGVPDVRGLVGLQFVKEGNDDDDKDGISNGDDKCPTEAEDKDGYQDDDGCPEPDNDGDGIRDLSDKCPNQPETVNDYQDKDGCPDEIPDRDHDGIRDEQDQCPDKGGDVIRQPGKFYGCPDSDKDGVPDNVDKCPNEPEDTDGFQDEDGCPDPDNDNDGVPDDQDECVDQAGPKENRGCPVPVEDKKAGGKPKKKSP